MNREIRIPRRSEAIRKHLDAGGRVAAVFPIHYPRALLRAFGLLPVEVWGPPGVETSRGDAHLQSYTCGIVRRGLSFLLGGGLDAADVVVVPHACDSLQGLGSLLLDFLRPRQKVLPLYLPRASGEPAVLFLADELRSMFGALSELTGRSVTDDALAGAVAREERADRKLRELADGRALLPFSDGELYRLLRAREYLPAEEFAGLADRALGLAGDRSRNGVPLLVSGIVPEPMSVFESIEQAGGRVAADDFACVGRRLYPPGNDADPFLRMARGLLGGPPDSTLGCSVEQRVRFLSDLAERTDARGVLFYELKFCEPEQFYLPQLQQALQSRGLRTLVIEGELAGRLAHQDGTRIEAFLESLS